MFSSFHTTTSENSKKIMNGDITSAALHRCQCTSKVISPFIIFAVFDVSFRRVVIQSMNDFIS